MLLGQRLGQRILEHQETFRDEKGIPLFLRIHIGLEEFFNRQILVFFRLMLPEFVVERDFMGRFEATDRELEIEVIEFLAKELADRSRGVRLNEVIADEMENRDEGIDKVRHGRDFVQTTVLLKAGVYFPPAAEATNS